MKNWIKITIIILLCFGFMPMKAQKVYAVLAGSTNVFDIGKGCDVSIKKMEDILLYIEKEISVDVEITKITGDEFTKNNIVTTINNLNPTADDVIFFFSTSHGFNYQDVPSQYAFISAHPTKRDMTKEEFAEFGLSLEHEVYSPLLAKGARLTITLAEACNTIIDMDAPSNYQVMSLNIPKRLKELFLEAQGSIISSSSQLNQQSWTDSIDGGIYTNMFIQAMNDVVTKSKKATWKEVMDKTGEYTQEYARNQNIRAGQAPISETDIRKKATSSKLIETEEAVKPQKTEARKNDFFAPKIRIKRKKEE